VPQRCTGVRIEGVYRVVFGRHEHDIVGGRGDGQLRKVKRLRIDLAVYGQGAQQSKRRGTHIRERQGGFRQILTGATDVILVCHDVGGLCRGRRSALV
jgi:hypothetical protein